MSTYLKDALLKKTAEVLESRQPMIPGILDVGIRGERTETPAGIREHSEIEAIPQLGAYIGAAGLGAVPGAGIGAAVAGKGKRLDGALLGAAAGGLALPIMLALAKKSGMLKFQETATYSK
jgi:hypothetical protein